MRHACEQPKEMLSGLLGVQMQSSERDSGTSSIQLVVFEAMRHEQNGNQMITLLISELVLNNLQCMCFWYN